MNRRGLLGLFGAFMAPISLSATPKTEQLDTIQLLTEIRNYLKQVTFRSPEEVEAAQTDANRKVQAAQDFMVCEKLREHIRNNTRNGIDKPPMALLVGWKIRDAIERNLLYERRHINTIKIEGFSTIFIEWVIPIGYDHTLNPDTFGKFLYKE